MLDSLIALILTVREVAVAALVLARAIGARKKADAAGGAAHRAGPAVCNCAAVTARLLSAPAKRSKPWNPVGIDNDI